MENKKNKILLAVAISAFVILIIGATYAYFQNQYSDASQANVKVMTYTTDVLTFETGDDISITADQESFAKGKGNQTGSTYASALLRANNKTNTATANYYIYLNIESNEFIYTSEDNKAELVLQVTDNSGNPVTSIDGLTYVTVVDGSGTSISGFDITDKSGLINLVNNKEISASPRTEEQYNVTLVLINYDFDQNDNAGKNFNAKLMIQKKFLTNTLLKTCSNGDNLAECIKKFGDSSISEFSSLYFHNGSFSDSNGKILDAEDNSYRYAGENRCSYNGMNITTNGGLNSCLNAYAVEIDGKIVEVLDDTIVNNPSQVNWNSVDNSCLTAKGDKVFLPGGEEITKDECSGTAYYVSLASSYFLNITKHENIQHIQSVNNYVCFGSIDNICPDENLYRIIGIFKNNDKYNIKLIKAIPITKKMVGDKEGYYPKDVYIKGSLNVLSIGYRLFGSSYTSTWSGSYIKDDLNTEFITYLDTLNINDVIWKNKIQSSPYYHGILPHDGTGDLSIKEVYQLESNIEGFNSSIEYKIGLMFLSDYCYATNINNWSLNTKSKEISENNWMYLNLDSGEWTMSETDIVYNNCLIFKISSESITFSPASSTPGAVRPVFYLNYDVKYSSGSGTKNDPIRLVVK